MLFMVIERFKRGDPRPIRERFAHHGRMLPDGVIYHASWVDATGTRCFPVMEAQRAEALAPWMERWRDLIDFEVVPVLTSADFWSTVPLAPA
jgi:hypothetical protein